MHYRFPNHLHECVRDTWLGGEYLHGLGHRGMALVGHSFGRPVVISADAISTRVTGVVAMSRQTYGTSSVNQNTPRPLLLLHGSAAEILPDACSRNLYARAREPKEIKL